MELERYYLLGLLGLPMLGMLLVLCMPAAFKKCIRWINTLSCAGLLGLSLYILKSFAPSRVFGPLVLDPNTMLEFSWIPTFHVYFRLGLDGLALSLIVLCSFLCLLASLVSFRIERHVKAYHALFLLLVTAMLGVFVSLDMFLFYVFWELMLLPMYFLIGIWGGENRQYSAIKFFIYTLVGSVFLLFAILIYYVKMQGLGLSDLAFNIPELIARRPISLEQGNGMWAKLVFVLMFLGFAVKVPIFPFHTWLPSAHVEAPTAISVILAGVLLKMGTFGLFRFNYSLLPDVATLPNVMFVLSVLGLINIIYGALCALAQRDFKRLVAYSSVSHMGFVIMGLACANAEGINGAVFQMLSHGVTSGLMFMLVGVLYERAHHREILKFGGISSTMPKYFALALIGFFASLGLPGLIGFVGEILVFLGVFAYSKILALCASVGMLLTAAYILLTMQRVFLGEPKEEHKSYSDCSLLEYCYMTPLILASIVFGVAPTLLIEIFRSSVEPLVSLLSKGGM